MPPKRTRRSKRPVDEGTVSASKRTAAKYYFNPATCTSHAVDAPPPDHIIDWARTSGQTECPLSLDAFKQPVLLSVNGRSYSLPAFQYVVDRSLENGAALRLEDITIPVFELQKLKLYPNYSLPGWKSSRPPVSVSWNKIPMSKLTFNMERATACNMPMISMKFAEIPPGGLEADNHFDGKYIYEEYQRVNNTIGTSVENLIVERAIFPRASIKNGPLFRNILFRDCVIPVNCWHGIQFFGCRFEQCTFICAPDSKLVTTMYLCETDGCAWMWQASTERFPEKLLAFPDFIAQHFNGWERAKHGKRCIMRINPGTFRTDYLMRASWADVHTTLYGLILARTVRHPVPTSA